MAIFRIAHDVGNLALDMVNAALFGLGAQETGVCTGIEVIGMDQAVTRISRGADKAEAHGIGCRTRQVQVFPGRVIFPASRLAQQPPVVQLDDGIEFLPDMAEGMQVFFARHAPVFEFDADFHRAVGGGKEFAFVDPAESIELADRRDSRLADADGSYGGAFDQRDAGLGPQRGRQHHGSHPAGRPAANDQELRD